MSTEANEVTNQSQELNETVERLFLEPSSLIR